MLSKSCGISGGFVKKAQRRPPHSPAPPCTRQQSPRAHQRAHDRCLCFWRGAGRHNMNAPGARWDKACKGSRGVGWFLGPPAVPNPAGPHRGTCCRTVRAATLFCTVGGRALIFVLRRGTRSRRPRAPATSHQPHMDHLRFIRTITVFRSAGARRPYARRKFDTRHPLQPWWSTSFARQH